MTEASTALALSVPKGPAQTRARAVIAARKVCRWPCIAIAIEGDIPRQIAEKLDVVGSIGIEMNTPWLRQRRQDAGINIEAGFVEAKELHGSYNDGSCKTLVTQRLGRGFIVGILPA